MTPIIRQALEKNGLPLLGLGLQLALRVGVAGDTGDLEVPPSALVGVRVLRSASIFVGVCALGGVSSVFWGLMTLLLSSSFFMLHGLTSGAIMAAERKGKKETKNHKQRCEMEPTSNV